MRRAFLVLLTLLGGASAETDAPVTPERADAIFAWFDQLPLPGLHGSDFVRVWPGGSWSTAQPKPEPNCFLAFLLEDGKMSFRVLSPDGKEKTYAKRETELDEEGFIGFRKVSLLDEARKFLADIRAPGASDLARRRLFSDTFAEFQYRGTAAEAEDAALARWCARLGDRDLALSFLQAARVDQLAKPGINGDDSLETSLQKVFLPVLRAQAYHAFADKNQRRPDLLANFQKLVALCPDADLTSDREAIQVLERMIREDAAHPALTDEEVDALPPEKRAEELVFRLRDENRLIDPVLRGAAAWPSNGALRGLQNLGLDAAPALIKALDDDSFTREAVVIFAVTNAYRVKQEALVALKAISGCNFAPSSTAEEYRKKSESDLARMWWQGVSEKGEKNYLMERITAGDVHCAEFASQLMKKYSDEATPFLIAQSRAAADPAMRVTLSKNLWNRNDPRCRDFFAAQLVEGRELGDRVAAAHGLRSLQDPRADSAMGAEWERLVALDGKSGWPVIVENDPSFANPWSVADFLATSTAPEASLRLAESAAALPVEWRAKIVSRLADSARGNNVEKASLTTLTAKKAIEDALHDFLTDPADNPVEFNFGADLIGAGRVCDLAALKLHEIWPQKYEFDRWLSPLARSRQCDLAFNVRAQELGEVLRPVPAEAPQKPLAADAPKTVSDVLIAPPLDKSAFGARIAALRGAALDGDALVAALTPVFSQPENETHGFVLNIARFHDGPGISIHLLPLAGPKLEANARCEARLVANLDAPPPATHGTQQDFERWSYPQTWRFLSDEIERLTALPPETAFVMGLHFDSLAASSQRLIRARPKAVIINK